MSKKSLVKTLARTMQAKTDRPYQSCLNSINRQKELGLSNEQLHLWVEHNGWEDQPSGAIGLIQLTKNPVKLALDSRYGLVGTTLCIICGHTKEDHNKIDGHCDKPHVDGSRRPCTCRSYTTPEKERWLQS